MRISISDLGAAARKWMTDLAGSALISAFLSASPVPASRPRVARFGGVYYGKPYEKWRVTARPLAEAIPYLPTDQPLVMLVECVTEKPKTGKLQFPKGDVDNFVKGPLDIIKSAGRIMDDDNQIVFLSILKRYAAPGETPGVLLSWFPLED